MDISDFYRGEKLYRAVRPISPFITADGKRISSAAFTQSKSVTSGLSVDKQAHRNNEDAVKFIAAHKQGYIISITIDDCEKKQVDYEYCKIDTNLYHSEIYGDKKNKRYSLSKGQAKYMAKVCTTELKRHD